MIAHKGREACRLSVMLVWLHLLMHASGRPTRVPNQHEDEATQPTNQSPPTPLRPCRKVPKQELWIRLDSAQFYAQQPAMEGTQLKIDFAPASQVPTESFSLRHPRSLHSNLPSETVHSTASTAHDTTPKTRHIRNKRGRKSRRKNRLRKQRNKARKKFLKRAANITEPSRLRKLFSSQSEQWQCQFEEIWDDLGSDYFPRKVRTGRCQQTECMFGFYECRPKLYELPVLRRDPLNCNPLPNVGPGTEYEEAWVLENAPVVVGCECSPVDPSRTS